MPLYNPSVPAGPITTSGLTQATNKLLGRGTASTGAIEEITLGTGLSFTGTTLNSSGGGALSVTVDVTAAELRTSESIPIELIAAQGSGKVIHFLGAAGFLDVTTVQFQALTEGSLVYDGSGTTLLNGPLELAQGESYYMALPPRLVEVPLTEAENKALTLVGNADDDTGAINATSIADGGANYAPGDTFYIGGEGFSARGEVDTVGALGVVTAFHVTVPGFGYVPDTGVTTFPLTGVGTGLTVDIDSITPANSTLRLILQYEIVDVP